MDFVLTEHVTDNCECVVVIVSGVFEVTDTIVKDIGDLTYHFRLIVVALDMKLGKYILNNTLFIIFELESKQCFKLLSKSF